MGKIHLSQHESHTGYIYYLLRLKYCVIEDLIERGPQGKLLTSF